MVGTTVNVKQSRRRSGNLSTQLEKAADEPPPQTQQWQVAGELIGYITRGGGGEGGLSMGVSGHLAGFESWIAADQHEMKRSFLPSSGHQCYLYNP